MRFIGLGQMESAMGRDVQQEREKKKYQKETERKRCIKEEEEDFPGGPVVKNPPANAEEVGWILGRWGN